MRTFYAVSWIILLFQFRDSIIRYVVLLTTAKKNLKDIAVNFIAYLFPLLKRDHTETKMKYINVV